MKIYSNRAITRLLWFLTLIAVSFSLLSSCSNGRQDDTPPYIAETKDEIRENIAKSLETEKAEFELVSRYLASWGLSQFDTEKFNFFEIRFNAVYNYENGMPDIELHAKDTAEMFLETYYDEINMTDVTAVTDSLLTCYVETLGDPYAIYRPPLETDDYNTDMSGKFGGIGE